MQKRRAAARETDNENGPANFLFRNFGILAPVAHEKEPVAQNSDDVVSQRQFSNHIQPRLTMAGFQQARERFEKVRFAEVFQRRPTSCFLDQLSRG